MNILEYVFQYPGQIALVLAILSILWQYKDRRKSIFNADVEIIKFENKDNFLALSFNVTNNSTTGTSIREPLLLIRKNKWSKLITWFTSWDWNYRFFDKFEIAEKVKIFSIECNDLTQRVVRHVHLKPYTTYTLFAKFQKIPEDLSEKEMFLAFKTADGRILHRNLNKIDFIYE